MEERESWRREGKMGMEERGRGKREGWRESERWEGRRESSSHQTKLFFIFEA